MSSVVYSTHAIVESRARARVKSSPTYLPTYLVYSLRLHSRTAPASSTHTLDCCTLPDTCCQGLTLPCNLRWLGRTWPSFENKSHDCVDRSRWTDRTEWLTKNQTRRRDVVPKQISVGQSRSIEMEMKMADVVHTTKQRNATKQRNEATRRNATQRRPNLLVEQ